MERDAVYKKVPEKIGQVCRRAGKDVQNLDADDI